MTSDHVPLPEVDARPRAEAGTVVLSGGCFWCLEAIYSAVEGVVSTEVGYAGESTDASYDAIASGELGHVEALWVVFDPRRVSFGRLLHTFFAVAHDPSSPLRARPRWKMYRSVIFTNDEELAEVARRYVTQLRCAQIWDRPLLTSVEPLRAFYVADATQQKYVARNPEGHFARDVVAPKLARLRGG